jgi:hypothetical protein
MGTRSNAAVHADPNDDRLRYASGFSGDLALELAQPPVWLW